MLKNGRETCIRENRAFFIVFTDLDGTLLDHDTYSFEAALPALRLLKKKGIPLIICTSKTRAEIEETRKALDNHHPFISENGGSVFIPRNYFDFSFSFTREDSGYFIIELGTPYSRIREAFRQWSRLFPGKLRGFSDLSAAEISDLCGLSPADAELARKREYDEPFILKDETILPVLEEKSRALGLRLTRGGRFHHLTGDNDKGKAVRLLKAVYEKNFDNIKTIGLGDSLNDLPMLEAVDFPVLVQKPDGSYDPSIRLDHLIPARGIGPEGWAGALVSLLVQHKTQNIKTNKEKIKGGTHG